MIPVVKLDLFTNVSLRDRNTLGVPSVAGNYVEVTDKAELKQALTLAKELELPVLILGGGSNVILPDMFAGLVIKISIGGIALVHETDSHVWLKVGAGENWHDLVLYCLNFHYWGIENLSLIPGTVGAAPIQNIGAYGVELKDVFAELTAIERLSLMDVTFDQDGCEFGYRDSIFKQRLQDQYVIADVTLKLTKTPQITIEYPVLRAAFANRAVSDISPGDVSAMVCEIRRGKLPDPAETPNAGSFFKNPIVSDTQYQSLLQQFPNIVGYPVGDGNIKLAAGWLIEQAGWKGRLSFGVGMHELQALVLVNPGNKSSGIVLEVAAMVQQDVMERFGVALDIEPISYSQKNIAK